MIGNFGFKHFDGPGFFTFAPRFYRWASHPTTVKASQSQTVCPYDVNNLPALFGDFGTAFLNKAGSLGIKLAPSHDDNWHLDGFDYSTVMGMNMLWGSYITSLPNGNMGNLQVFPGSHHTNAHHFKTKGTKGFVYDGKKTGPHPKGKWPKLK